MDDLRHAVSFVPIFLVGLALIVVLGFSLFVAAFHVWN